MCFVFVVLDPFADANAEDTGAGAKEYMHIRIQQRNGRKNLTTVQGLKKDFSYNKILKDLKKEFCCNGTVVQDPELGQVCITPLEIINLVNIYYWCKGMAIKRDGADIILFIIILILVIPHSVLFVDVEILYHPHSMDVDCIHNRLTLFLFLYLNIFFKLLSIKILFNIILIRSINIKI